MRYLVKAKLKPGREKALLQAIEDGTLGAGSVAVGEHLRNMARARRCHDGTNRWVEVCYCPIPLEEERPYWEESFELVEVEDAHSRQDCRDDNGTEPWACGNCDCTAKLEAKMEGWGEPFLTWLRKTQAQAADTGESETGTAHP